MFLLANFLVSKEVWLQYVQYIEQIQYIGCIEMWPWPLRAIFEPASIRQPTELRSKAHACLYGLAGLFGKSTHQFPENSNLEYTKMYYKHTKTYSNMLKYIQIYPRYRKVYQDIQNIKRRRGRLARPGPVAGPDIFGYIFGIFKS